jgi:LytS/YehU family sensor histidine kinase
MKPKVITVIIQILVWSGLLLLPLLFTPHAAPREMPPMRDFNPMFSIFTTVLPIGFYYFNYYLLIPLLYLRKKTGAYILSVIGSLLLIILVSIVCSFIFTDHSVIGSPGMPPMFGNSILLFVVVLFVSLGLRINSEWKKTEEEKIEIEKEKLNAELSYLKAQVNPHFLFNTLNVIYMLATVRSEQTAEAVMKLSKLMRYVISDAHTPFVPLEKELGYVGNFIELHRLRLANNNEIDYRISGNPQGLQIVPFILIPFVENAIKHGTSAIEPMMISIETELFKNELHFTVKNNKLNTKSESQNSTGVGIENTRKRLEMIYNKKFSLQINETDKTYEVKLNLILV